MILLFACSQATGDGGVPDESWSKIKEQAQGSMVRLYMNGNWNSGHMEEIVKERFGITLVRVPLPADVAVTKLAAEHEHGLRIGDMDIVVMDGKAFRTACDARLLLGPFSEKLPNYIKHVDKTAMVDGVESLDGFAVPTQAGQLVAIPSTAPNKAGAMVVANYLIFPVANDD